MGHLFTAISERLGVRGVRARSARILITPLKYYECHRITHLYHYRLKYHSLVSLTDVVECYKILISFLIRLLRGLTRVTYTTNNSHPCHSIVSLTRNNTTRMLQKYLTRASRSNTGTRGIPCDREILAQGFERKGQDRFV